MKVSVTKQSFNDNTYRTPLTDIDGMPNRPEIGKNLLLTSSTHESGGIITSIVNRVQEDFKEGILTVETYNSTYVIKVLGH